MRGSKPNLMWIGTLGALGILAGCATSPGPKSGANSAVSAAENAKRARPFLEGARAALAVENSAICRVPGDPVAKTGLVSKSGKSNGSVPSAVESWKTWVLAGGACVREQKWAEVLRIGEWLSQNEMEAPWGPYFLSLHAQSRGESLRAHWLLDLAEKKAGGELSIVQYERARQSLLSGETRAAVAHMKSAVARDSELAPGHLWLAQVHEREQMWDEAAAHYSTYLSLRPKSAAAHFAFAEVQLQRQKSQEAVEPLLRAIHLDPSSLKARLQLALVYDQLLKDPEASLKVLKEARSVAVSSSSRSSAGKLKSERNRDSFPGDDTHLEIQQIDQRIRALEEQVKARQPAQAQSPRPSASQAVPPTPFHSEALSDPMQTAKGGG